MLREVSFSGQTTITVDELPVEETLMFVARNYVRTDRFKYEIELTRA